MDMRSKGEGSTLYWVIACVLTAGAVLFFRPKESAPPAFSPLPTPAFTNTVSNNSSNEVENLYMRREGAAIFPLVQQTAVAATEEERGQWVGAAVCGECHEDNYRTAVHTSHYKTSSYPTSTNLLGVFDGPDSWMKTANPMVKYRMFREKDRFYQSVLENDVENHRASIDLIVGSGKLAQTFATWVKDDLYELPLTALQPHGRWVNSPGYPDGIALYNRPVNSGCLKCHATGFVAQDSGDYNNRFKSRHIVAGITCERCHGFGRKHVEYHRANPEEEIARHILDPRKLGMSERHALCSQCHGGMSGADADMHKPGVHSNNQLPRLKKSACYIESGGMSCVACHNPHRLERGNDQLFASRCQNCHKVDDCKAVTPEQRTHFAGHCAKCHMKKQTITDISFQTREGKVEVEMVDHFVRIFSEDE